jgi:ribose transport system ATP-binding protein
MGSLLLRMKGITKAFPGVRALDEVDFELHSREVHGLVGENGAGKSTLIKVLSGAYIQDSGEIFLDGKLVSMTHPSQALDLGIVPVHQEPNLVLHLSVAENIYLGRQPRNRLGLIDYAKMNHDAQVLLDRLQVRISPRQAVSDLSVAERQMTAIARAMSVDAQIVILDEPTAPLTDHEAELLFRAIEALKSDGVAVIYISHRLEEVFKIADRVTVLRDGRLVGTEPIDDLSIDRAISMMIGKAASGLFAKRTVAIGEPVLEVRNLYKRGFLEDISLTLRRGEILGMFGLAGSGRSKLASVIFGSESCDSGEVLLRGKRFQAENPAQAIRQGIGLVPEDRRGHGLVSGTSVKRNISLPRLRELSSVGIINERAERQLAKKYVDQLQVRTPSIDQDVAYLSGGNQQRVVIAKWLATNSAVLLLDEPTQGIDVGAKAFIHSLMCDLAGEGIGILMISSELTEILRMSDRVLVMHRGQITGRFTREEATEEGIMRAATGED